MVQGFRSSCGMNSTQHLGDLMVAGTASLGYIIVVASL
jgi:hypothetical protein